MSMFIENYIELFNYQIIILYFILSFVIGSVPFGLIITKISGYGDIRKIGSGNIGATNVFRTGNKCIALLTLLLDISKSLFILYLAKINFQNILDQELLTTLFVTIALLSLLGHMFSPVLSFKGGKGIATSAGILFFFNWIGAIIALIIWLIVVLKYKTSSLGALSTSILSPLIFWFLYEVGLTKNLLNLPKTSIIEIYLILLITCLIWIKHIPNIKRIIKGKENKI